jgi:hypothetical protein
MDRYVYLHSARFCFRHVSPAATRRTAPKHSLIAAVEDHNSVSFQASRSMYLSHLICYDSAFELGTIEARTYPIIILAAKALEQEPDEKSQHAHAEDDGTTFPPGIGFSLRESRDFVSKANGSGSQPR